MMYYSVYLFIALQIVQLLFVLWFFVTGAILEHEQSATLLANRSQIDAPEGMMLLTSLGLVVVLCHVALINPYIALLRANVRFPTKLMHTLDCLRVQQWIDQYEKFGPSAGKAWKRRQLSRLPAFAKAAKELRLKLKNQDDALIKFTPMTQAKFIKERASAYRKNLKTDKLREKLSQTTLLDEQKAVFIDALDQIDAVFRRTIGDAATVDTAVRT